MYLKPKPSTKEFYTTKDLYFASALRALGIPFIGSERKENQIWFLFGQKEFCEESFVKYISSELFVNAKRYEEGIKTLKGVIFNDTE